MMPDPASRAELFDENVFKLLLGYEVARSQRYASPLSLLRIGLALIGPSHVESSNVPIALAAMLNIRLRRADIPARFGNGFAVLLPTAIRSRRSLSARKHIVSTRIRQLENKQRLNPT